MPILKKMSSNEAAVVAQADAVWLDANRFFEAESRYYQVSAAESQRRANPSHRPANKQAAKSVDKKIPLQRMLKKSIDKKTPLERKLKGIESSLASEIAFARKKIQTFLKNSDLGIDPKTATLSRLEKLEQGYEAIIQRLDRLTAEVHDVLVAKGHPLVCPKMASIQNGSSAAAGDDDIDLFGSDEEEDAAAAKVREERLKAYANKKAKKPALVAKSSVVLDVKPWDDETDMKELEKAVRAVKSDGLVWGASKLVPLAYGINKLQIVAVVEDEKVSIDWLQETICEIEDLVQSVDVAAFNKL